MSTLRPLLLDLTKRANFGSTVEQRTQVRGRGDADEKVRRRLLRRRAAGAEEKDGDAAESPTQVRGRCVTAAG